MLLPKNHKFYSVNSRLSCSYVYYVSVFIYFTLVYAIASGTSLCYLFNYIFIFVPNILRKCVNIIKERVKMSSLYAQRAMFRVG